MGHHWDNFVANDRLLRKAGMSQVTCLIQHHLELFGHVARLLGSVSVSRVVFEEISSAWMRPCGRPPVTWLQRIDSHCRELEFAR